MILKSTQIAIAFGMIAALGAVSCKIRPDLESRRSARSTPATSPVLSLTDEVKPSDGYLDRDPNLNIDFNTLEYSKLKKMAVQANDYKIRVLAVNPYRNSKNTFDVNNDGLITSLDALCIINELNRGGGRVLPAPGPDVRAIVFVDVTGDGTVSALDALRVINHLNIQTEQGPFSIIGPTGTLTALNDKVISWTKGHLMGQVSYEVSLSSSAECDASSLLATRTGLTALETPFFTEVRTDGDYFLCLSASNDQNERLTPVNQSLSVKIALDRFHTVFFSKEEISRPEGLLYPDSPSNLRFFDLKCSEFAADAGLIKDWNRETVVYKAIMSDDFTSARDRLAIHGKVLDTKDHLVASSEEDFWDGQLSYAIVLDARGERESLSGNTAFTGTLADGSSALERNCNNWTVITKGLGGMAGLAGRTVKTWVEAINLTCSAVAKLYCMSPLESR